MYWDIPLLVNQFHLWKTSEGSGGSFSTIHPSLAHFQPTEAHFLNQLQIPILFQSFLWGYTCLQCSPQDTSPLYLPQISTEDKRERKHSLTQHCLHITIFLCLLSFAKMRSLLTHNSKPQENGKSWPLTSELPTVTLSINLPKTVVGSFNLYPFSHPWLVKIWSTLIKNTQRNLGQVVGVSCSQVSGLIPGQVTHKN